MKFLIKHQLGHYPATGYLSRAPRQELETTLTVAPCAAIMAAIHLYHLYIQIAIYTYLYLYLYYLFTYKRWIYIYVYIYVI